jgi:hypothetical protein
LPTLHGVNYRPPRRCLQTALYSIQASQSADSPQVSLAFQFQLPLVSSKHLNHLAHPITFRTPCHLIITPAAADLL